MYFMMTMFGKCYGDPLSFKEINKIPLTIVSHQLLEKSSSLISTIENFSATSSESATGLTFKTMINWRLFAKYPVSI